MNKELALKHRILELRVGSHLYGLNRPESDEDYSGIVIPPKSYFFGLDKVEEVDCSIVSKKADGRNDKDAVDRKFYEIRKFVGLAMQNNPNIIEQLFVTPDNIIFINEFGQALLDHRHLFPHRGLKGRFCGYAMSQKQKMYVKRDNMLDIDKAIKIFQGFSNKKDYVAQWLDVFNNDTIRNAGNQHIAIGDIHIQKNITIDRALEQLEERKSKFSGRKEMVDDYGYDVKFAMHLIRLLLEGKELLETGKVVFPLKDETLLRDIRAGQYSMAEISEMAEDIENEVNLAFETSPLPSKPDYNAINNLLVSINESYVTLQNVSETYGC